MIKYSLSRDSESDCPIEQFSPFNRQGMNSSRVQFIASAPSDFAHFKKHTHPDINYRKTRITQSDYSVVDMHHG